MTLPTERPTCATCGSFDLSLETLAVYWDRASGGLDASGASLCDKGHYCNDCDGETRLAWVHTALLEVTLPELDTMIAALRYWQRMEMCIPDIGSRRAPDEFDIASERGDPIDFEAIDKLVEKINS